MRLCSEKNISDKVARLVWAAVSKRVSRVVLVLAATEKLSSGVHCYDGRQLYGESDWKR